MRKVLVLEDEDNIRSFVVLNLNRAGYDTLEATTGEEALEILREHPETRIALLDVNLPGIDGFEVCRRIRATNSKMGIIMLTARTLEMDKVTGLMTGADDYVTKPFSPAELTARVDALYRRSGGEEKQARHSNGCFIKQYFPQVELHEIPKMDHAELVMMYPQDFYRRIMEFLTHTSAAQNKRS